MSGSPIQSGPISSESTRPEPDQVRRTIAETAEKNGFARLVVTFDSGLASRRVGCRHPHQKPPCSVLVDRHAGDRLAGQSLVEPPAALVPANRPTETRAPVTSIATVVSSGASTLVVAARDTVHRRCQDRGDEAGPVQPRLVQRIADLLVVNPSFRELARSTSHQGAGSAPAQDTASPGDEGSTLSRN